MPFCQKDEESRFVFKLFLRVLRTQRPAKKVPQKVFVSGQSEEPTIMFLPGKAFLQLSELDFETASATAIKPT